MCHQAIKGMQPQESVEYHRGVIERGRQDHNGLLSSWSLWSEASPGRRSEMAVWSHQGQDQYFLLRPLTERHRGIGGWERWGSWRPRSQNWKEKEEIIQTKINVWECIELHWFASISVKLLHSLNSPELILNEIAWANALGVASDRQGLKPGLSKDFKTFSSPVAYS